VKLFQKHSNAYGHSPPTFQTDRETDRQTTYHGNTALRYTLRAVKTIGKYERRTCSLQMYRDGAVNLSVRVAYSIRADYSVLLRGKGRDGEEVSPPSGGGIWGKWLCQQQTAPQ